MAVYCKPTFKKVLISFSPKNESFFNESVYSLDKTNKDHMNLFVTKNLWINHYLCLSLVGRPGKILFCRIEKVDRILKMNIGWNEKKYDAFTEPWSVQQKWSLDLESRSCSRESSCGCSGAPVCTCLIFAYLKYLHISKICIYKICTFLIFPFTISAHF